MKLKTILSPLLAAAALAGCMSTPQELKDAPTTTNKSFVVGANYQEVYRNIAEFERCGMDSLSVWSTMYFDTELYSELGYGELAYRINNTGSVDFQWVVRVTKIGPDEAKVDIAARHAVMADRLAVYAQEGVASCH